MNINGFSVLSVLFRMYDWMGFTPFSLTSYYRAHPSCYRIGKISATLWQWQKSRRTMHRVRLNVRPLRMIVVAGVAVPSVLAVVFASIQRSKGSPNCDATMWKFPLLALWDSYFVAFYWVFAPKPLFSPHPHESLPYSPMPCLQWCHATIDRKSAKNRCLSRQVVDNLVKKTIWVSPKKSAKV